MKTIPLFHLTACASLLVLGACASSNSSDRSQSLAAVWTQPAWPPESMPAPPGFSLTPHQAYQAVATAKRLSLKHHWFCYRDDRSYYVADAFALRASAGNARRFGVQVDGTTGDLTSPKE